MKASSVAPGAALRGDVVMRVSGVTSYALFSIAWDESLFLSLSYLTLPSVECMVVYAVRVYPPRGSCLGLI